MPGDAEEGIEVEMLPLVLSLAPCGEAGCFIRDTEVVLSFDISLLGGLPVPPHGLGMVLLHPLTVFIHDTEIELTAGMNLLGRLPVAAHGLGMV